VETFFASFPPTEFYLDAHSISLAIETQGMFNLIHISEGDKVDFWILTKGAFDESRFSRRMAERVMGIDVYVSRPEDTILMKMQWAKLSGGSEKQFTDALRVYEVQRELLDMKYIEHWARELQLDELWNRLKDDAESTS
ncbi:MAG TPA: hypothetical protein VGR15_02405, partial [Bacteroidota bacterium]|nr:hypothetical protein [Bacteroidota bacterium]